MSSHRRRRRLQPSRASIGRLPGPGDHPVRVPHLPLATLPLRGQEAEVQGPAELGQLAALIACVICFTSKRSHFKMNLYFLLSFSFSNRVHRDLAASVSIF